MPRRHFHNRHNRHTRDPRPPIAIHLEYAGAIGIYEETALGAIRLVIHNGEDKCAAAVLLRHEVDALLLALQTERDTLPRHPPQPQTD